MDKTPVIVNSRALVLHPYLKQEKLNALRTPEVSLEEGVGLTEAIDLEVLQADCVPLGRVTPATLIGEGKVEEYVEFIKENEIELVIINTRLSPVQQRNLERAWNCKVIDRTALILEIFGARARTNEGKLQVELAALEYQRGRLVRSWTHLERQRGGSGFMGGPGETQIELDRRQIDTQIVKIKKLLEGVKRTRELHRKSRSDVPYPIVALVGYTNAGKSTLFNYLTKAEVLAEDMLFATLDPTMRQLRLPSSNKIILSDTVGFISELPTELVAAFRATLEEVVEADIILHVRDISSPETEAQKHDVEQVLKKLGMQEKLEHHTIEVWNKIDLLEHPPVPTKNVLPVSAITGQGIEALQAHIDAMLAEQHVVTSVKVDVSNGKLLAWLYSHGEVLNREDSETDITLRVRLSHANHARLLQLMGEC